LKIWVGQLRVGFGGSVQRKGAFGQYSLLDIGL